MAFNILILKLYRSFIAYFKQQEKEVQYAMLETKNLFVLLISWQKN